MKYFTFFLFIFILNLNSSAQIKYSITYLDSSTQRIKISIQLVSEKKAPIIFIMPRSIPGAYSIINYDSFIDQLYAITSNGERKPMIKDGSGAPRWYYNDSENSVKQVEYEIDLRKMEKQLDPSD